MAKYTSYDSFQEAYLGKPIDYDGIAGVQCVDLADQYLKDVFDITGVWVDGARDLYNKFSAYPALVKNFNKIPNTRDLVVQKGDIVIWGGGTWGHVGIGTGNGNIDWFESLEENTLGKHEPTQIIKHYFNGTGDNDGCNPVLGVLRAKDQSKVIGEKEKNISINPSNESDNSSSPKKIVDISQYQTNVNYAEAAKEIDGILIRIGYRGWGSAGTLCKDSQFENHVKGAINNNIPFGFYFFSQATNAAEAKAEADYAYDLIKTYNPVYPIYIDIEDSGAPNNTGRADGNTKSTWTEICKAFCDRINELGLIGGIYAGEYWMNNKVDITQLKSYSIWCAKYGTNNGTAQSKPNIPVDYDGWQFTSAYKVKGFSNGVDMSYFYKNFDKKNSSTPTYNSTSTPVSAPVSKKVETSYKTYYVICDDGLNYRATPNGALKGTLAYGAAVKVIEGSEQKVNNLEWVKIENGNFVAKKFLSTVKPSTVTKVNYKEGNVYTLQYDMKVRAGAGSNYIQKKYAQLTVDGKKNAYKQNLAVLKKGTKVTIQKVIKNSDTEYWAKIPSGYICLMSGNTIYVK